MDEYEKKFEMLKLITGAEHHFNNLTFNIRALASTWLLAVFAGSGWILKDLPGDGAAALLGRIELVAVLCACGSVGIFVLWVLDLRVYQQLLNVWFEQRKRYEEGAEFPDIRRSMKNLFGTGRASEYIKFYYLATCSAPLLFAMYVLTVAEKTWLPITAVLLELAVLATAILLLTPSDRQSPRLRSTP